MTKALSILMIAAISLCVGLVLLDSSPLLVAGLLTLVLLLMVSFLVEVAGHFRRMRRHGLAAKMTSARLNLFLHVFPAAYLVIFIDSGSDPTTNTLFLIPLMAFFYTGRRCWEQLHRCLGRKLYYYFMRGNTSLLVWLPISAAIQLAGWHQVGDVLFARFAVGYFVGHLLVIGPVTSMISSDLRRATIADTGKGKQLMKLLPNGGFSNG
jgi:hypothetical protein